MISYYNLTRFAYSYSGYILIFFLETDCCIKDSLNKDVVRLINKLKHKIIDMEQKVIL